MADWKFRGYVPDSDDEDDESHNLDPQSDGYTNNPKLASDPVQCSLTLRDISTRELQTASKATADCLHAQIGEGLSPRHSSDGNVSSSLSSLSSLSASEEFSANGQSRAVSESAVHGDLSGFEDVVELQRDCFMTQNTESQSPRSKIAVVIESVSKQCIPQSLRTTQPPIGSFGAPPPKIIANEITDIHSSSSHKIPFPRSLEGTTGIYPEATDRLFLSSEARSSKTDTVHLPLEHTGAEAFGGRSLRRRNLTQLHPYTAELEQYRKSLKSRGLQPVHIAEAQSQSQSLGDSNANDQEQVSASSSQYLSQQTDLQLPQSKPRKHTSDALQESRFHSSEPPSPHSQDELPDLSSLIRRDAPIVEFSGAKRRKITRTPSRQRKRLAVPTEDRTRLGDKILEIRRTSDGVELLDSPAPTKSPILSSRRHRSVRPVFKLPHGTRPQLPPTPLPSSELTRQAKIRKGYTVEENVNEGDSTTDGDQDFPDVQQVSSEDDTAAQDLVVRKQAKLTRGVLPASHAKIELVMQAQRQEANRRTNRPECPRHSPCQRGVAKVRSRPRTRDRSSGSSPVPIMLSDDDESASFKSSHGSFSLEIPSPLSLNSPIQRFRSSGPRNTDDVVEAEEDDDIDAMLLPCSRRATVRTTNKNSLQRPKGSPPIITSRTHLAHASTPKNHHQQPKITRHLHRQKRRRSHVFRAPRLSVADINHCTEGFTDAPDFIRVATRTARARIDKGRHSPTRKYLRFPVDVDTQFVSKILHDWRQGSTQQPANDRTTNYTARPPLKERSANVQRVSKQAKKHLSLQQPTSFTQSSKRTKKVGNKPAFQLQNSFDHIINHLVTKAKPSAGGVQEEQAIVPPFRAEQRLQLHLLPAREDDPRPAILESSQRNNGKLPSHTSFRQRLVNGSHSKPSHQFADPLIARFFNYGNTVSDESPAQRSTTLEEEDIPRSGAPAQEQRPKNLRKKTPKRLEISSHRASQDGNSPEVATISDNETYMLGNRDERSGLFRGLKPYGSQYTTTFDIPKLPAGTYFHESTFIGSGAFAESLTLGNVDLDHERRAIVLQHQGDIWRWGVWNQNVSEQLELLCTEISICASSPPPQDDSYLRQSEDLMKKMVSYFSHSLSFADPVDRVSFSRQSIAQLSRVLESIQSAGGSNLPASLLDNHINICSLLSVMAHQIKLVAKHKLVPASTLDMAVSLVRSCTSEALQWALRRRFSSFRLCLENVQHMHDCVYGVRQNCATIEALVITRHLLSDLSSSLTAFWSNVNESLLGTKSPMLTNVSTMERLWENQMLLLPFLDFDVRGVLKSAQRQQSAPDNWEFIKTLISAAFQAYTTRMTVQPATLNVYCRALLGRCLHLIKFWSWNRCESLIGVLFDFFAQHGLAPLPNEQGYGSPSYLEHLNEDLDFGVEPVDQSFHIFLKIIAIGLQRMRRLYPVKKIRDIVWRLMPNHGRTLRKEEDILATDMAALRNHHDLLCTLYWACPPEARPCIRVIQNLVEIETSHREACHISIRSWANLLRFQLSTSEPVNCLKPFTDWYITIYLRSLTQHALAWPEAEREAREASKHNIMTISKDVLDTTVSGNQRQVEAVLLDVTTCLRRAMQTTMALDALRALITGKLTKVFEIGCKPENSVARRPQLAKVMIQVLEIIRVCSVKALAIDRSSGISTKDDSQDYGDWSEFVEDFVSVEVGPSDSRNDFLLFLSDIFQNPLKQLLSNLFGSDETLDNGLLQEAVETWVLMAAVNVKSGSRTWSDYVAPYGRDTLRETEQKRKFSAFFFAKLIDEDSNIYATYRPAILRHYLASLVERESLLRYQHLFTNALLNIELPEPLLYNSPFWKRANQDHFGVTTTDLSSRRLALISSILSNMRVSVECPHLNAQGGFHKIKNEYKDLLKHMMAAMKQNYQDLGQGSTVRGAYVVFAQSVIELLQQHTAFIYPVDRFFTDSSAFPLPDADPNYVVGQLKNYALRLRDPKTPKQLAVFIQSVTERAVVDSQEEYLVSQLHTAMCGVFESGLPEQQSLRSFLINSIAPPYIEAAVDSPCGTLLATPFLRSLQPVVQNLVLDLDGTNGDNVGAAETILSSLFNSIGNALHATTLSILDLSRMRLLALCFSIMASALPMYDYTIRLKKPSCTEDAELDCMVNAATDLLSMLLEEAEDFSFDNQTYSLQSHKSSTTIQSFVAAELKTTLNRSWSHHDGRCYVTRGNQWREVKTDLGTLEEEKWGLVAALDTFLSAYQGMWYKE